MKTTDAFGAELRYGKRLARWNKATHVFPELRHRAWWILHNVVAHPAIGLWPTRASVWFHDWTSKRLDRRGTLVRSTLPVIGRARRMDQAQPPRACGDRARAEDSRVPLARSHGGRDERRGLDLARRADADV